jgi:hypothetical protein
MPSMPSGDPFSAISKLLESEKKIRNLQSPYYVSSIDIPYWRDIEICLYLYKMRDLGTETDKFSYDIGDIHYHFFQEAMDGYRSRWFGSAPDSAQLGLF